MSKVALFLLLSLCCSVPGEQGPITPITLRVSGEEGRLLVLLNGRKLSEPSDVRTYLEHLGKTWGKKDPVEILVVESHVMIGDVVALRKAVSDAGFLDVSIYFADGKKQRLISVGEAVVPEWKPPFPGYDPQPKQ